MKVKLTITHYLLMIRQEDDGADKIEIKGILSIIGNANNKTELY
ncbi:hypothetical protein MASR2M36_15340 [Providencia sp.]